MRFPRVPSSLTLTLMHVLLVLAGHVTREARAAFQLPPFLQTLSEQTLSQSQASGRDRLFTLPTSVANVPNIRRFTPRKKHLKPRKLMRRLRKDWDPFWMSVDRPVDADGEVVKEAAVDPSLLKSVERLNLTLRGQDLDPSVADLLGAWLVRRATCHVHHVWDDLGVLYWPRWLRRGFCQAGGASQASSAPSFSSSSSSASHDFSAPTLASSCSWPPGMHCVPAESRRIRILRWQCRHNKAFNNWNPRFKGKKGKGRKARRNHQRPPSLHGGGRNKRDASVGVRRAGREQSPPLASGGSRGERDTYAGSGRKTRLHQSPGGRSKRETYAGEDRRVRNVTERAAPDNDDESNDTENWSRKPFTERRRKLSMRCKWKKIPYPVTDDCFCSC